MAPDDTSRDLRTPLRDAEASAHGRGRRAHSLFEKGTWTESVATNTVTFSAEFAAMLEYDAGRDGDASDAFYGMATGADRAALHALLQSAREGRTTFAHPIDVRVTTCRGAIRHLRIAAERASAKDGAPIVFGTAVDVSELAQVKEELRNALDRDSTTGLPTRKRFEELLDAAVRGGATVAVAAIELDVVADPDKRYFDRFGVEKSPRALLDPAVWPLLRAGYRLRPSGIPDSSPLGLPADLLIAPDGTIVACDYGRHAGDQWSVDTLLQIARAARGAGGGVTEATEARR